jgi:hypothetical protein
MVQLQKLQYSCSNQTKKTWEQLGCTSSLPEVFAARGQDNLVGRKNFLLNHKLDVGKCRVQQHIFRVRGGASTNADITSRRGHDGEDVYCPREFEVFTLALR